MNDYDPADGIAKLEAEIRRLRTENRHMKRHSIVVNCDNLPTYYIRTMPDPNGDWVLHKDAQAEIDALPARYERQPDDPTVEELRDLLEFFSFDCTVAAAVRIALRAMGEET